MLGYILVVALIAIALGAARYLSQATETPEPATQGSHKHWLIAEAGPLAGQALHIGSRAVTVGRGVTNFIQVTDENVSRRHCQLSVRGDGLYVVDLKSRNGTEVNGSTLLGGRRLRDGDVLHLGSSRFLYKVTGEFTDSMLRTTRAADSGVLINTLQINRSEIGPLSA